MLLLCGCEMEAREKFWSQLDELVDSIPREERVMIGADFNGHVAEGKRCDEGDLVSRKGTWCI